MSAPVTNVETPDITRKGRRRPPRTPKGRQVDPVALDEVRALLTDRPRRRDLLIEHLHLIQDHYHHLSAAHLTALAAEMKMALAEVYEVATFYSHFDVVKEGEDAPPAVTVRVCDSISCAMAGAEALIEKLPKILGKDVRVVRAPVHGRLRPRAGRRRRPCADLQGQSGQRRRGGEGRSACACVEAAGRFRRLSAARRLRAAQGLPRRQAHGGRSHQDRQRRRPARPRRRRLPDRSQVVAGARRARAAPVRGQCRRGRARHLQGPLLSRARSAPLPRRRADRRLGGRGARHLHLHPRRISRAAADARSRRSTSSPTPACRRTPGCICAAAPAPISAAKSRR